MFHIELDSVLVQLVEAVLSTKDAQSDDERSRGLYVRVLISASTPLLEDGEHPVGKLIHKWMHFLFRRDYRSTNVWVFTSENIWFPAIDSWKNTSNHDSCWRSDGIRSPIGAEYFKLCKEVDQEAAPISLKLRCNIEKVETERVSARYNDNFSAGRNRCDVTEIFRSAA
jgi:hypothetical protein